MNYNQAYPPYMLPAGGFDLDAFIKFAEYMKAHQPKTEPPKSKSEVKDFLRLWSSFKEADEKKKKEDDEQKKKADEKKKAPPSELPTFTMMQVFMLLLTFGLPVGAVWLTVMEASFQIVKKIIVP